MGSANPYRIPDDLTAARNEINDLRKKVAVLEAENGSLRSKLATALMENDALSADNANMHARDSLFDPKPKCPKCGKEAIISDYSAPINLWLVSRKEGMRRRCCNCSFCWRERVI